VGCCSGLAGGAANVPKIQHCKRRNALEGGETVFDYDGPLFAKYRALNVIHASRVPVAFHHFKYVALDIEGTVRFEYDSDAAFPPVGLQGWSGLIPANRIVLETVILPTDCFQRTTVGGWEIAEEDSARASVKNRVF